MEPTRRVRACGRRSGRSIRVLMFGWEFPPYQAGGLATATLGLVKGLLQTGLQVTLVVPFPIDGRVLPELRLVSTAGLRVALRRVRVPSPLTPYGGVGEYAAGRAAAARRIPGTRGTTPYGVDLFHEIERFSDVAAEIAETEPHDVIDCHDWITYPAAQRAHEVSGRPLVAHIHATERDRSGAGENAEIRRREREGCSRRTTLSATASVCADRWSNRTRSIRPASTSCRGGWTTRAPLPTSRSHSPSRMTSRSFCSSAGSRARRARSISSRWPAAWRTSCPMCAS